MLKGNISPIVPFGGLSINDTPRSPMEDLVPEILIIIFEFCAMSQPPSSNVALHPSLLVCRRFNTIATPVAYRTFVVKEKCMGFDTTIPDIVPRRRFLSKVQLYCEHITIYRSPFPPFVNFGKVAKLISNAHRLRTIQWISRRGTDMPGVILSTIREKKPRVQIRFEEYTPISESLRKSLPVENLMSVHLHRFRHSNFSSAPANQLLVAARNVTNLTLDSEIDFNPALGRLPPIKTLSMRGFSSTLDAETFNLVWNFSRLKSLRLRDLDLNRFLSLTPIEELYKLEHFRVKSFAEDIDPFGCSNDLPTQKSITAKLNSLLSHFYQIKTLEIACLVKDIRLSLLKTAQTLRCLKLTDFSEYEKAGLHSTPTDATKIIGGHSPVMEDCPALSLNELSFLGQNSPFIDELILYLDAESSTFLEHLNVISRFKCLRKLTLRIQTLVTARDETMGSKFIEACKIFPKKTRSYLQAHSIAQLQDIYIDIIRRKFTGESEEYAYTFFQDFPVVDDEGRNDNEVG